jgi:lysozyme family protein
MAKNINQLIDEIIKREGKFSNHPADRGGPTMYGITQNTARAYGYQGKMQELPRATAEDIYKEQYWRDPGFDQVGSILPTVAEELADTGVNMGPQRAAKMLQRALNVLNRGEHEYPNISVDGKIGKMSMYALNKFIVKRGAKNAAKVLLRLLDAQQAVRYMEIAEANPSQEEFMYGWVLNRVGVETNA